MAKYLLTAIFLGLLISLFYEPTPEIILEDEQQIINNTPTSTEDLANQNDEINLEEAGVFQEEDIQVQKVALKLQ